MYFGSDRHDVTIRLKIPPFDENTLKTVVNTVFYFLAIDFGISITKCYLHLGETKQQSRASLAVKNNY